MSKSPKEPSQFPPKFPSLPYVGELLSKIPSLPHFGELLQNYRLQRGLTVEQLAAAANLPPSAIRAMEHPSALAPSKDTINTLAKALRLGDSERSTLNLAATLSSPFIKAATQSAADPLVPPILPASILVFLIADVRGYTHFTLMEGDDAAARLASAFAEIARTIAERWDGRLLELRGDEALLIFGSLRQALQAALAMQTRFEQATQEQPDLPLQVGIGLDVGEAVAVEQGYRGMALNRAARLCSMAGAGEILVTAGCVYVASKVEGIEFLKHSQAQLKGFDTPIEIMRVLPSPLLPEDESKQLPGS
jgi:class 3 adenylate cyclase